MTLTSDDTAALFPWNDEQFRADPYPYYERARQMAPVHRTAPNSFVVLNHGDAFHNAKLPCMRINEPASLSAYATDHPWQAFDNTVLSKEPPEHTRMRRLTNRWLTPKMIGTWAQLTHDFTVEALDRLAPGDVVDAHFELGVMPTHLTMCRILDMPVGDPEGMFWALWDAMLINATAPGEEIHAKSLAGMNFMFAETEAHIADKRKADQPGNGLVDELLAAHDRGELTWREVLETSVLLYMSGGPNPAYLIGAGFKLFAERPDLMKEFAEKPEIREAFVNELARLNPVELIITRFTAEDLEIQGVVIPAGSCIKFPIGAANRDPAVFENPNEFDYHRPPDASRNLTFGLGTHACAGQLLSRAETIAILTIVAERYTKVELVGEPTEVRTDRLVAFDKLPVRLS
jgi:cytochrome P450